MRLIATCFHLLILLWCSTRGYSKTNVASKTTGPFFEDKRIISTMAIKEATENMMPKIESNGSDTARMNYTRITSPVETIVNNNESAKIDNTLIVTTSTFENSTDEDDNDADNVHSSFNLALIPAAAVFVLMIFICFKCCKWFRKYTRGGNKDVNYYAVILTDDDIGHIPIDTISSNTSLLKGCDNENKPSYRDSRKGSKNKVRIVDEQAEKYVKNETNTSIPNDNICFTNSSSSEKEPISSEIKRSDKLSVSFSSGKQLCEFQSRDSPLLTKQPNNVRCSVRKAITEQSGTPSSQGSPVKPVKVMTCDAGTQTNKSFRYSLRTSKRFMSERGMNKETHYRQTEENIEKEQEDTNRSNNHIIPSDVISTEGTNEDNTNLADISKYPIDTNVELIENIKETNAEIGTESDLVDDVFVEATKQNKIQNDDDLNVDLNCVVETCESVKSEEDHSITKSIAQPLTPLCTICKKSYCQAIKEHICDIDGVLLPDDISSTQTVCHECKLVEEKKNTDFCQTDNGVTSERTMTRQCDFTNVNDRPISSSSLESSGYAELSSSEYSSGSH